MNQNPSFNPALRSRATIDRRSLDDVSDENAENLVPGISPFQLAPLPYGHSALEPVISKWTVALHHGQHELGYINNLIRLVRGTEFASLSIAEIMVATAGQEKHATIFNNAAQAWNHAFYWRSLHPRATGLVSAVLDARIRASFGSIGALKHALSVAAKSLFGSGWIWLAAAGKQLMVITSSDAGNPMLSGLVPLLAIDVWEHAYYLDRQNRRDEYVDGVVNELLNWEFASQNLRER